MTRRLSAGLLALGLILGANAAPPSHIELRNDDAAGRLRVLVDGREAFIYQYAGSLDMPHYWPLSTPGGRNLLVQQTEPYPHHRSFWFADTVRLNGGRDVSFYNGLYSGVEQPTDPKTYKPPFRDHIRHVRFAKLAAHGSRAEIEAELFWEMDGNQAVLREMRRLVVYGLGGGDYLMDLSFVLTPAGGEVEFRSDDVHYAWPYLRLQTRWSGEGGGRLTADDGSVGQETTNMRAAKWIDYSNTIEGETAGAAVFQYPDGFSHRWLTREYGCFGPRRPDALSGKPFILVPGMSLRQRIGILIHAGDVKSGRVAERYKDYIGDRWK
ncbi:MAG: PmoA family protein [Candidatus Aminicenantes bacterium]|nr:PmoA family protein [Candidatus Aminicenantes bacterium]